MRQEGQNWDNTGFLGEGGGDDRKYSVYEQGVLPLPTPFPLEAPPCNTFLPSEEALANGATSRSSCSLAVIMKANILTMKLPDGNAPSIYAPPQ